MEAARSSRCGRAERPLTRFTFAFGFRGLAIGSVSSQQQLAQGLKIAPQDAQGHVTFEAALAAIAAPFQTVARLQGADRRLDARMMLSRFAKGHGCLLFLLTTLFGSFAGDARRPHDRCQFPLILRGVKGAVERGALDFALAPLLQ